jgi:hypothetical protein
MWRGLCECGAEQVFRGSHLRKGFSTSCGCKRRLKGLAHPLSTGCGEIPGHRWCQFKASAKIRNIPFDLTIEQAWDLFLKQNRRCALSGVPLEFGAAGLKQRNRSKVLTASLDRKDSTKGYTPTNVQWVHKIINRMKNASLDADFIGWCRLVVREQEKINAGKIKTMAKD